MASPTNIASLARRTRARKTKPITMAAPARPTLRSPEKVDHNAHAAELEKLGIDPGELAAKAGHKLLG